MPTNKCELCGEPMPPGEEVFKYHGYSGPCPKPLATTPSEARPMHTKPTVDQLANRFDHHAPFGDQGERYGEVRHALKQAAITCVRLTPCSPEQTRALNALDEAMFLFNAAIARNEKPQ